MKKKILITGIAGSGGSYLAEHIINKNIKIYGILRNKRSLRNNNLKFINHKKINFVFVDLTDYSKVYQALKKIKPDIIFHLASNADVLQSFKKPLEIINNNNACTLNLLEACKNLNLKKTVIQICSTSEVYGNVEKNNQPITEKNIINPINPYAASKTFQDLISQIYLNVYGLKIIITRMFTYLNPKRKNLFASSFAHQIIDIEENKQKILKHGNLDSKRSILDIRDAMESYWIAATRGRVGEIYNISGSHIMTIKQFLNELKKNSKSNIITQLDKKLLRPTDIDLQISDCKKFKIQTKWREKYKFKDTIKYFLNECRKYH